MGGSNIIYFKERALYGLKQSGRLWNNTLNEELTKINFSRCKNEPCRLGLNCANFVRWSMCNGGMDLCSRGSTFARGMAGVYSNEDYFPGAIRVQLTPTFQIMSGSFSGSKQDAINTIKPGDVLYSEHNGSGNHVMLIVGTDSDSITIAENGRKTRKISKSELSSSSMTYVVLLLDDYYADSSNRNSLSW